VPAPIPVEVSTKPWRVARELSDDDSTNSDAGGIQREPSEKTMEGTMVVAVGVTASRPPVVQEAVAEVEVPTAQPVGAGTERERANGEKVHPHGSNGVKVHDGDHG